MYRLYVITPAEGEQPKDTNKLWTFIKHWEEDPVGIPSLKDGGILKDGSKEKADILNRQFKSKFTEKHPIDQDLQPENENPYPNIEDLVISTAGVLKLLENINPNKAMGSDELYTRVMKQLAPHIAHIFQAIFTKSLLPTTDQSLSPVSLSKLMEHIVTKHMITKLETNNTLYDIQHGFWS